MMHAQRFFCLGALVLIASSLLLVALDRVVMPGTDHSSGECVICRFASCLTTTVMPPPVLLFGPTASVGWMQHELPRVAYAQLSHRPFSARSPPASRPV